MGFAMLKRKAHSLFNEARFLAKIKNNADYEKALSLMDELIDDYDYNKPLIDILSASIEKWENKSKEFTKFNENIQSLDPGIAVLQALMEQHNLSGSDFPEIGSKSLISKIMNGNRRLTIDHINALCERFSIDPALFFNSQK